jgi:hypothetical protein
VSQAQKVWTQRIKREEQDHKDFRRYSRKVEKIFRVAPGEEVVIPLYWSVVGVEHAGVYSNQPVPEVRPRNEQDNPVYTAVATTIQRGLNYAVEHPSFDSSMHRCIDDFLAMGLGVPRVKVDSIITETTYPSPIFAEQQTPMGPQQVQVGTREETNKEVGDQTIRWEYVPWARFGWEPCTEWKMCSWIYFRHRMTMLQIKKRFGRTIKASKDTKDQNGRQDEWKQRTYDIYEVWDKSNKKVLFIAKGEHEPIEEIDDPLALVDFWPIPQAMMTNIPSEELVPQPDYDYIKAYDAELNRLQERRMSLLEQIKASGAYDQGMEELNDILDLNDGEMKPIMNMMSRMQAAGGADNFIWMLPLSEKLEALRTVTEQMQVVKAQVDEILGISDIVRGVTQASETAKAQEIKGRWVGVRLTRKRETVIYTVKSMMKIMAQLLASHITPENLSRMTQMEITEEMQQVLSDDMMMEFVIDIETDSTIAKDEFQEKETFQEMLNGVAQFSQSVLPMVQANQMPATVSSAILQAALRPYAKYDRSLEEALGKLPQTTEQLKGLNEQLQKGQTDLQTSQGETQQAQQQQQYWQSIAEDLQRKSTEAATAEKLASTGLKEAQSENTTAKTREIYGETKDGALQPVKTAAEINELEERAESYEQRDRSELN